ncbi:MAG: OmpA family protein [Bacteroidales bacterium]|nr:OmpA family protein [Bacteroidales bacterium]
MKTLNLFFLLLLTLSLLMISCSVKRPTVKIKADKREIFAGDSIKFSWNIAKSKKISEILLNDSIKITKLVGDTLLKPDTSAVFSIKTKIKGFVKPSVKKVKISVKKPEIESFTAYRDRFDSTMVIIKWKTKNFETVMLHGFPERIPSSGEKRIRSLSRGNYTLVGSTPFQTISKTVYVEGSSQFRPFVYKKKNIEDLGSNQQFNMEILETNIDSFPNYVKLKVLVYDSLGNFITNLAPPFANEEIAKTYFKSIAETVDGLSTEIEYEVKEVRESPQLYDVALTLDYSGSMTNTNPVLEDATAMFISMKFDGDKYSLIKFDHRLAEACELTNSKTLLSKKSNFKGLDTLGGSTALYAAIGKGINSLENAENQKVVMLFTDGFENSSFGYLGQYTATINQVVKESREKGTKLILVGYGTVNYRLLKELSYYTNGSFYYLDNAQQIYEVYKEMQHNFRTYYEIIIKPVKKSGEHLISLNYFNTKDTSITQRPYFIGDVGDFMALEIDTASYWYNAQMINNNYYIATAPQALVNFDLDKSEVKNQYYQSLQNIVKYMKANPRSIIKIYGHTDTRGSENYNMELSKRRAEAVKRFLISKGISVNRIESVPMGKKLPVYQDDKIEFFAAQNRRVEFVIWDK